MRVLMVGEPSNAINPSSQTAGVLRALGDRVVVDPGWGWRSGEWCEACQTTDVIHLITYSATDDRLLRKLWQARRHGVALVRVWVGSDCLWAQHHPPSRRFARALDRLGTLHLTVSDTLRAELARIGINARTVPVIAPGVVPDAIPPALPLEFAVLCFLPTRRRDLYGGDVVDRVIERLPEVRFRIVQDSGTDYSNRPNVESLGHVDSIDGLYAQTSVLLRMTRHDGMPRMILEALARGRHVVTRLPFPHCHLARDAEAVVDTLRRLRDHLELNGAGRRYVLEHFDVHHAGRVLSDALAEAAAPDRAAQKKIGRQQAIGLALRTPGMFTRRVHALPRAADLAPPQQMLRLVLPAPIAATAVAEGTWA